MKRKTSTTPTKIWTFWAKGLTQNAKLFWDQLFHAHCYYNKLIEIERKRREEYRQARSSVVPELAAAEARYQELDAQYKAAAEAVPAERDQRKKKLPPEVIAIRDERKAISLRMRELREQFKGNTDAQQEIAALDQRAHDAVIAARAQTEAFWGSYLLIEKQVEQARKATVDPSFKRFQGTGRIGVQLQGGLTVPELLSGEDTRLRLLPRSSATKSKNPKAKHEVWIRVGSEGRAPVWAVLPVCIHRELPPDGKIMWAWIRVTRFADEPRFELQLALESESFRERTVGSGTVAINFGWRANEGTGRRVAYAVDDQGLERELLIPDWIERKIALASSLRSARDLRFEEAKRAVVALMALHPEEMPERLVEDVKFITHWRSSKKLAKVSRYLTAEYLPDMSPVAAWRADRLSSQADLLGTPPETMSWFRSHRGGNPAGKMAELAFYLELWRRKDVHLWQYEATEHTRVVRARRELFRNWARQLAATYAEICIEDFDLRKMAAKPQPDEQDRPASFRKARSAAAPGELRSRITEVCAGKIHQMPSFFMTVDCHLCGHRNERAKAHVAKCTGCGATWDQDSNNCRNQLRERLGGAPQPGGARNPAKPAKPKGHPDNSGANESADTSAAPAAE